MHRLITGTNMLLAEVAHGGGGRVDADLPAGWDQVAGEDLEEGGLADAIGTDDAETGGRPDGQRHVVEHGVTTAIMLKMAGNQARRGCRDGRWHGELRDGHG